MKLEAGRPARIVVMAFECYQRVWTLIIYCFGAAGFPFFEGLKKFDEPVFLERIWIAMDNEQLTFCMTGSFFHRFVRAMISRDFCYLH